MALDLHFGGLLRGSAPTRYAHLGAKDVTSTDLSLLPTIFPAGTIRPDDVLVDVGCGRGRVIQWWLHAGYRNRMVGLELDPDIAARTARRLRRFANVEIRAGDAVAMLPPEGTLFYLFNPFTMPVMTSFAECLQRLSCHPDRVRLHYLNPVHVVVFEDNSWWQVRYGRVSSPWSEYALCVVSRRSR